MRWTPAHAEAELLVDMLTARLPAARIAQRLNIDVATLRSYMARLAGVA
jgi:DNA-binding CsgD family transcriptional regulator